MFINSYKLTQLPIFESVQLLSRARGVSICMHVGWCEADGKTACKTLESSSFGNLIRRELLYRLKSKIIIDVET